MEPVNEGRLNKVIDKLAYSDLFFGVVDEDSHMALGIIELMRKAVREYKQLEMEDYITELEKEHLTKL